MEDKKRSDFGVCGFPKQKCVNRELNPDLYLGRVES